MSGTQRSRLAVVWLAAALAMTGCHRAPATDSAASSAPTSTASRTSAASTEMVDRAAVEAAYRRFWAVSWSIDKQPSARWRSILASVATEPVLTRLVERTGLQVRNGITRYGQVIPHPTVSPINGARTVTVRDCQDAHAAGQADRRTGEAKTVGVARSPVVGALVRGPDGVWRVSDIRYTEGTC
jgi:hypothetical protein